jgi:outer membrane protein OmpA-like peptidoglycan-associated protein
MINKFDFYNIMRYLIPLIFLLFGNNVSAQKNSFSIADCDGFKTIDKTGTYNLKFTGETGKKDDFLKNSDLRDSLDKNMIWVAFTPTQKGTVSFQAEVDREYLQIVVFKGFNLNCNSIYNGSVNDYLKYTSKNQTIIGTTSFSENALFNDIELRTGQKLIIGFCTAAKSTGNVSLKFNFSSSSSDSEAIELVDNTSKENAYLLRFSIRDLESDVPVPSTTTIEGDPELNSIYLGSDILVSSVGSTTITVSSEAKGYFFKDTIIEISGKINEVFVIHLDPIGIGKTMQIEEIEFEAGTAEVRQESKDELDRLTHFLLINSEIEIEIQGHVYATGENTISTQRMSEERAKAVMKYLTTNGVNKNRLTAVGYGNTKPIYADAENEKQQQANRRVEIKVK